MNFEDGDIFLGAILIAVVCFCVGFFVGGDAAGGSIAKHCQMQGSVILKDTLYLCQEKK